MLQLLCEGLCYSGVLQDCSDCSDCSNSNIAMSDYHTYPAKEQYATKEHEPTSVDVFESDSDSSNETLSALIAEGMYASELLVLYTILFSFMID